MLPIAGPKGIGLAMMVEVLAGSLSGTKPVFGGNIFGGFVLLLNPLAVMDRQGYDEHMASWIAHYRESGPAARYPGERAAQSRDRQLQSGVALDAQGASKLAEIADMAGLELPRPV